MAEKYFRRVVFVLGAMAGVFALSGCLPSAQQFVVTSTDDGVDGVPGDGLCATAAGMCTLRAAVMEANASADRVAVVLQPQIYRLTLAGSDEDDGLTGDLDVNGSVQILGHGAVIDGAALDRVLDVHGGSLSVSQLTVQRGHVTGDGGGIRNNPAAGLTLLESAVVGNTASGADGGLFNAGSAGVVNASFFDNAAGANLGGGAANGLSGQLVMIATTMTGNRAGDRGGGLASYSATATNGVLIAHSVLTDNGRLADGSPSDCAVSGGPTTSSTIESYGFNFESGTSCGFVSTGDDRGDPGLGPIVNQAGTPRFRLPVVGSPLLDAIPSGTARCQSTGKDQRSVVRPQGLGCDIRAIEARSAELVVSFVGAPIAAPSNGGPITLSAVPAGGVFAGPGVNGNTFRPTSAGVGMRTVTYRYAGASTSTTIDVFRVSLTFASSTTEVPVLRTTFVFTGAPVGGTYSSAAGPLAGNTVTVNGCGGARSFVTYAGSYHGVPYSIGVLGQNSACRKP